MKLTISKEIKRNIPTLLFLSLISIVAYIKLFSIFYQQDEWLSFGRSLLIERPLDIFEGLSFWKVLMGKGRFLPSSFGHLFFTWFPFDPFPFALYSLLFHTINTLLVYYLARKLLKSNFFSIVAALFFTLNSVSSSAVSWYGTSVGTLPAVTLILLSIFTFLKHLKDKNKKWIIATFLLLYFSLFFKEIGVHLFLLYPFFSLLYKRKKIKIFIKTYWPFLVFFLFDSMFRVYDISFLPQESGNVFLTGSARGYFWQTILFRILMYPLTSFSLSFVHPTPFLNLARFITRIYYPFVSAEQFPLIVQTNTLDLLSVLLTFIIMVVLLTLTKKSQKIEKKNIMFLLLFTLSSFLPYIIISKNFSYLESRYYYLAAVTSGIVFAFIFEKLTHFSKRRIYKVLIAAFVLIFLFWHNKWLQSDLQDQVDISKERLSFLSQLSQFKPSLTKSKTVFYITSDTDYYMVGNKIPFQQGSGYTLMLWYHKSGRIPEEFFKDAYLYDLTSQGYEEADGMGFGYFSDLEMLDQEIGGNQELINSVVALYYDSKGKSLTDISSEIISKLQ